MSVSCLWDCIQGYAPLLLLHGKSWEPTLLKPLTVCCCFFDLHTFTLNLYAICINLRPVLINH